MGGYGSTRWGSYQRRWTVEESLPLDAWKLARDGLIGKPTATSGRLTWRLVGGVRAGEETANVVYFWTPEDQASGSLRLVYTSGNVPVDDTLAMESAPTNVGGRQWFFRCPMCEKRCRKLYLPPREAYFFCRGCGHLTYRCSQESRQGQALHRLIAAQLGTTPDAVRQALRKPR